MTKVPRQHPLLGKLVRRNNGSGVIPKGALGVISATGNEPSSGRWLRITWFPRIPIVTWDRSGRISRTLQAIDEVLHITKRNLKLITFL